MDIIKRKIKKAIVSLTMLPCFVVCAGAESRDTVRVADFGAVADSYVNAVEAIQRAIDACREKPGAVLSFAPGRYDIWPEGAVRKEIYISNTSSEVECPSKIKTIGLHMYGLDGITVEGNGATLMMHGSITPIAVDSCVDVTLSDFAVDFERPGGSELTYTRVALGKIIVGTHRDTRYDIRGRRLRLIGEGWCTEIPHCIKYTPSDRHFQYSHDWGVLSGCDVKELSPGSLQFDVPEDFRPEEGATLTIRDIIRREVGMLNIHSRNTRLENLDIRYMHGLGIVSQYSTDVTLRNVNCMPDSESGRILASSADFVHFSGCRGHIDIVDCNFAGAQDDVINVHGTNLQVTSVNGEHGLTARFMHHQSYGFRAFHVGDTVAFVNPATMRRDAIAVVSGVRMDKKNPREIVLTFDAPLQAGCISPGTTCVENLTWTPSLHVSGCTMTRISTRGILATTPRRIVIENNRFERIAGTAILIESDARDWYESGPVCDMTVRNNLFVDCGYNNSMNGATIALNPSNTEVSYDNIVHSGVAITDNRIEISGERPVVYAKSTGNLKFSGNTVAGTDTPLFILRGCADVVISGNVMGTPRVENTDCRNVKVSGNIRD